MSSKSRVAIKECIVTIIIITNFPSSKVKAKTEKPKCNSTKLVTRRCTVVHCQLEKMQHTRLLVFIVFSEKFASSSFY